jgi:hypothetical protein
MSTVSILIAWPMPSAHCGHGGVGSGIGAPRQGDQIRIDRILPLRVRSFCQVPYGRPEHAAEADR